jgi:dTDP-4-amino-4,6-dideoxygalactose transaminase
MTDIPLFKVAMAQEAIDRCVEVLKSGYVAQGPRVDELESKLSQVFKSDNIVTLNSCTSALDLAFWLIKNVEVGYDIDPDNTEVLCTPVTCAATNLAVVHNNLKIKWVDIDEATLNISLSDLKRKLSSKTRIVSLVHWGGYPVDLWKLREIQDYYKNRYGKELIVVEDAAHAFGSFFANIPIGGVNHKNFVCFSFQAIKSLTAGDGGCLTTPYCYYRSARLMRWFGLDRDNNMSFRHSQDIKVPGFKYHMNDVSASIALCNLETAQHNVLKQKFNAKFFHQNIQNPLIEKCLPSDIVSQSASWLHTLKVDDNKRFIEYMAERGIEANPVHTRNDHFTVFKEFRDDKSLPVVNRLESRRVCIPVGWWLSESDRQYIVDTCNEYS